MVEEKIEEEAINLKPVLILFILSLAISGYLFYKIMENQNIYKFGFITVINKPEFKFNNTINLFVLYDLNNTKNNNIFGEESVKLWVFLLYNFKDPRFINIGKDCEIIHNLTSETKSRSECLKLINETQYSVVILPDKRSYIIIDNKKKQFIVHVNKEDPDKMRKMTIFLKDLILGKFKFN